MGTQALPDTLSGKQLFDGRAISAAEVDIARASATCAGGRYRSRLQAGDCRAWTSTCKRGNPFHFDLCPNFTARMDAERSAASGRRAGNRRAGSCAARLQGSVCSSAFNGSTHSKQWGGDASILYGRRRSSSSKLALHKTGLRLVCQILFLFILLANGRTASWLVDDCLREC